MKKQLLNWALVSSEEFCRSRRVVSAEVDNTLLDLLNSSYPTKPHSIIANYYSAALSRLQITPKTSTNISRYLYSKRTGLTGFSQTITIIYLTTLSSKSTSARSKYERALNLQLNVFARSGVRRFHTIDVLRAIEFFMKYVLKRGTITLFLVRKKCVGEVFLVNICPKEGGVQS